MSPPIAYRVLLALVGLCHGYSFFPMPYNNEAYRMFQATQNDFRPRALHYFQPNDLNRPIIYPQLGMSPEYHNLVYRYITDFAGTEQPPHAEVEEHDHHDETETTEENVEESDTENKHGTASGTGRPELKGYFVPSDFILLGKNAPSPIFGNFNDIKLRKTALKESQFANPPLGGVMSNYVLLRNRPNYQSFIPFAAEEEESSATVPKELPVSKRQVSDSTDTDDTVVINAENTHSVKMNEEESRDQMTDDEDGEDEDQPAVAQSKPAAIALAGPGGVAQASPVGTALVGPGGLAVAAPSGTAVAGPAGQGVITPTDDKAKLVQKKIKEVWN